ncbi:MAG: monooxygenase [Xanthobacteraceae bacterium]|nr:monooxygenase [Xanthobacteraceae bacterium]
MPVPSESSHSIPIAIVGGGPVGLMLALFLDRHGVRSVVFNLEEQVRQHPKGSTQNARTMEHYRRLGISSQIRSFGLPADHPTDVAYFTRFNADELARLPMPSEGDKMRAVAASGRTDQVPEPILRANQMYVEAFLLDHARSRPNVTLRFGSEVTSFRQDTSGVTLEAQNLSGETETWRALYLAGCDGGRSFVRRSLGIQYEGYAQLEQAFFGGRMFSTYLRAPTLYRDHLGARRAFQCWVINPQLRTAIVALNGSDEFILWTKAKSPDHTPSDDDIAQVMRICTGTDIPLEIIAHRPWAAGVALVAERFAADRVLLAGDAVHLFTPTGGFGMNTGVDDAANLAWKLAAMVQGWGGPHLLESYERERKPIARRNTGASRALASHIGDVTVPAELEEDSPAGAAARREVGRFLETFGEEFASIGVQLGARYDGSPIVWPDGAPPPDDYAAYVPSGVPGGRVPHVWLGDGRGHGDSLFDRLGVGFTLLRIGPNASNVDAMVSAARHRGIPLDVCEVNDAELRALYGRDLVLVRPDQHIAWRGDTVPDDVDRLLARAVGDL